MIKRLLQLCTGILLFLFASCMSYTQLQVLKPADIFVPEHIQKVVVVNRFLPAKGTKLLNVLEGLLSGEMPFEDRLAAPECVNGLSAALTRTPRFTVTQSPFELEGVGGSYFPPVLTWEAVEKICTENGADALITLEIFDSNVRTDFSENQKTVKNKEGVKTTETEYVAVMGITVTNGWRLYDPKTKQIIDEKKGSDCQNFKGKGSSKESAENALADRSFAIKQAGFYAGNQYGSHISPSWITLTRGYFRKGSDIIIEGYRKAICNDWVGASEIWKKEIDNPDKKIAGRATFNMAVACEVEGRLDLAMEWAKKAYTQFDIGAALNYMEELKHRMDEQNQVNEQLKK